MTRDNRRVAARRGGGRQRPRLGRERRIRVSSSSPSLGLSGSIRPPAAGPGRLLAPTKDPLEIVPRSAHSSPPPIPTPSPITESTAMARPFPVHRSGHDRDEPGPAAPTAAAGLERGARARRSATAPASSTAEPEFRGRSSSSTRSIPIGARLPDRLPGRLAKFPPPPDERPRRRDALKDAEGDPLVIRTSLLAGDEP